eukprot:TRINITY_DN859_c0_g1_i4.p1 TRINITY_DN859_c0_g1~~TRINITY_DN859_c0_g1_i4.p1  ORF type:complete len:101 (-),score=7.99 TRINITY_DN859_c0_g1_i4:27-329(-)
MVASPTHISTSTSSFNCWTVIVGDTLSGREFFPTTMYTLSCFSSSFSIFKDNTNFRQRILETLLEQKRKIDPSKYFDLMFGNNLQHVCLFCHDSNVISVR